MYRASKWFVYFDHAALTSSWLTAHRRHASVFTRSAEVCKASQDAGGKNTAADAAHVFKHAVQFWQPEL